MKACFTAVLKCKDMVLREAILVALPLIVSQMLSSKMTKFFLVGPLLLCQAGTEIFVFLASSYDY